MALVALLNVFTFRFSNKRESKKDGRAERISIDTDHQLEIEFKSILSGKDKLQRKSRSNYYYYYYCYCYYYHYLP